MIRAHKIVGLGELLWDFLPGGKEIGGAPANFAYIVGQLGDRGIVASRIGDDALGVEIKEKLVKLGVETPFLQLDSEQPTGTVNVSVDAQGQPNFEIANPVAWDFFEWGPIWESLAREADAVYFGTLGQRATKSRATTEAFLDAIRSDALKIFDANLRQSFYSAEVIAASARLASIMKLNHDELPRVMNMLGLKSTDEKSSAQTLLHEFNLRLVCVTRGERGSLLVTKDAIHEHPGFCIGVVDTVGAGDAFTATLVYYLLRGAPLAAINHAANRMGAWVASHAGGTPPIEHKLLEDVRGLKSS